MSQKNHQSDQQEQLDKYEGTSRELNRQFYQIPQTSPIPYKHVVSGSIIQETNQDKILFKNQATQNQDNLLNFQQYVVGKLSDRDISLLDQSSRQQYSEQNSPNNHEKIMHSMSTTGVFESRRKFWIQETLREIQEKQESQERSSKRGESQDSNYQSNFYFQEKKIQKKRQDLFYDQEQKMPSLKTQKESSVIMQKKKSRKKTTKNKSNQNSHRKNHCIVTLKFPANEQNHSLRKYNIGMNDLNHQWFKLLDSIHKQQIVKNNSNKITNSTKKKAKIKVSTNKQ